MPKKILIVDDDPDVILFLSTVVKDHGYIAVDASNGQEGLERAKSDHPDLILLDLMMPRKSGIALLSDLKRDDALKEIPVIMVTGVSSETGIDLEAFFNKGATGDPVRNALKPEGYIEKPVDPQKLLKMIKEVLS